MITIVHIQFRGLDCLNHITTSDSFKAVKYCKCGDKGRTYCVPMPRSLYEQGEVYFLTSLSSLRLQTAAGMPLSFEHNIK